MFLIKNALLVNEGKTQKCHVAVEGQEIKKIIPVSDEQNLDEFKNYTIIDAEGKYLFPGVIDDHVHFREPGLTNKADIYTESCAAVAGGVTSFMDMPNTLPATLTLKLLEEKFDLASIKSLANYSFYMGASNYNLDEVLKIDPKNVCGVKVYMGSSTGNLLVDEDETLNQIFKNAPCLIATHCEDETIIRKNMDFYRIHFGDNIPPAAHSEIRNAIACFNSSSKAIELATKFNSRLHLLHLSTATEMNLLKNDIPLKDKKITAEVCLHHLWFNQKDYLKQGNFIKWNPSIKTETVRLALWDAILDDRIDVIATDHAPHTKEEKQRPYLKSPSGGPMIQHLLVGLLEFNKKDVISLEKIAEKLCHNPAIAFNISKRGFVREGYFADLVIVDPNLPQKITEDSLYYKCGWSPLTGTTLQHSVTHTFVNGNLVFENGRFDESNRGMRLTFDR